jgi:hypothetical protein
LNQKLQKVEPVEAKALNLGDKIVSCTRLVKDFLQEGVQNAKRLSGLILVLLKCKELEFFE